MSGCAAQRDAEGSGAADQVDAGLIAACLAGDDAAWEALVDRYSRLVYTVARRTGLGPEDAAEVHWAVWTACWEALPTLRQRDRLAPWLITVTARLAWRTRGRSTAHPVAPLSDALEGTLTDTQPLPEELLTQQETSFQVRRAIARLGEPWRTLLIRFYLDPQVPSYAAMAQELGLSKDSIGSYRQRSLARLRTQLLQDGMQLGGSPLSP
jgi:RNA polymerase sigma factor (sigma-70 family)